MDPFGQPDPTWLEIDLAAVYQNTRTTLETAGVPLMAVVKSNAYGLGAVQVGRTALNAGAAMLAVARFCEARVLRQAGIDAPILVFGLATPREAVEAACSGVSLTLASFESAEIYAQCARQAGCTLRVHLKVDTGFGRLGVLPEEALALARKARELGGIEIEGLYSHLAMADEEPDHPVTLQQIQRFETVIQTLDAGGLLPRWIHLANSAGAFGLPNTRFNLVRVGTALVGMKPFYFLPFPENLRRVVSWKACLASCKKLPTGWGVSYGLTYQASGDEWIGVIPVGYGDGFRRVPNNEVLIEGVRCSIVGRVCNDMCMVRLPGQLPIGTEIVLIGQQGTESITTDDLVARWKTSQADIISTINLRVPRHYVNVT